VARWDAGDDSDLNDVKLELPSREIFVSYLDDARIMNKVNPDGDGCASQFDLEFDVDSNMAGNFYVKTYYYDGALHDLSLNLPRMPKLLHRVGRFDKVTDEVEPTGPCKEAAASGCPKLPTRVRRLSISR